MAETTTQVPNSPLSKPESTPKSKSWLLIGLFVLLIISLATTIFLACQNYQLRQRIKQAQIAAKPTPTPATQLDPTANWKTYLNTEYGYSLKYPSELTSTLITRDKLGPLGLQGVAFKKVTIQEDSSNFYDNFWVTLGVQKKDKDRGLKDYVAYLGTEEDFEEVAIAGVNGYQKILYSEMMGRKEITSINTILPFKDTADKVLWITIGYEGEEDMTLLKNLNNQILSTFKFLD